MGVSSPIEPTASFLVLRQHADDVVALFLRDVEHLLIQRQRVAIHGLGREPCIHQIALEDSARPGGASSCRMAV